MINFYLITTKALSDRIWFRDTEDFRVAMNYVAVVASTTGVNVLAFILMSNHVHFVTECDYEKAKVFCDRFKMLNGAWLHKKYGYVEFLRRVGVDIRPVRPENESLLRAIAYVQMNSVAANICPYPNLYGWGTGAAFFNPEDIRGYKLGTLSKRSQFELTHSRTTLPASYLVGDAGYILPQSYVPVRFVEGLFRSAKRYLLFLNNSSKAGKHLEKSPAPSFEDHVLISAILYVPGKITRRAFGQSNWGTVTTDGSEVQHRFEPALPCNWHSVHQSCQIT
ncbi:MAG: hypothetical protein IKH11_05295 [Bacteroidales bacterium]|nr:hypothetical protein [Bacteroidales bacterium]